MNKTIEDFRTRSDLEARMLFRIETARERNWSPERAMICNIFKSHWSSSFDVERIELIAQALNYLGETPNLQPELSKLVREKTLRSVIKNGVRHYELDLRDDK